MTILRRSCTVLALFSMFAALAGAQSLPETHAAIFKMHPLTNGIEVSGGGVTVQVTALRDDVLRVRASRSGDFIEDESWAVLAGPRAASVPVVAESAGFSTKALRVSFDSAMRLTVSDLSGHILQ